MENDLLQAIYLLYGQGFLSLEQYEALLDKVSPRTQEEGQ